MKYKFILSLLILSIVGLAACHSTKKSSSSSKKTTAYSKGKKGKKGSTHTAAAVPIVAKRRSDDSLFVSLERTPCMGTCPSYKIEIYYKGFVVYHGYTFSERTGDFYTVLPKEQLVKIFNYAKAIKYFSFNDSYVNPNIVDAPSTIVSMQVAKKIKTVTDGHDHTPSELIFFEKLIDESFTKTTWMPLIPKR
jgi:hypothetical protein